MAIESSPRIVTLSEGQDPSDLFFVRIHLWGESNSYLMDIDVVALVMAKTVASEEGLQFLSQILHKYGLG